MKKENTLVLKSFSKTLLGGVLLKKHDFFITYVYRKRNEKGNLEIVDMKDMNISVETKYKRQTSVKYAIAKGLYSLGKGWDYYMWI
jgi:hypothetical protein